MQSTKKRRHPREAHARPHAKATHRSRALRRSQTDAEALLWHHLRDRRLAGFKFRRQVPIGPYFADL